MVGQSDGTAAHGGDGAKQNLNAPLDHFSRMRKSDHGVDETGRAAQPGRRLCANCKFVYKAIFDYWIAE